MVEFAFYQLRRTPLEKALPRLLEKVLESGRRAVVLAASDERAEALNAALWTYDQGSFLPHGTVRDGRPERQPIFLATDDAAPNGAHIVVMVDGVAPTDPERFERCLDMFDGTDPDGARGGTRPLESAQGARRHDHLLGTDRTRRLGAASVKESRTVRDRIRADLCVIGAGSAGLSLTAGAVQMGASVILIEQSRMGGECLNTGCVPSKALLAAAARGDGFAAAYAHMRNAIGAIEPHDSAERFRGLGAYVVHGKARFVAPRFLEVGDVSVTARRFVIATGSSPVIPAIPGLDGVPYLTNETLFDTVPEPSHLLVLGGGPIGVEMAQAYRRLGARVTLFERETPARPRRSGARGDHARAVDRGRGDGP